MHLLKNCKQCSLKKINNFDELFDGLCQDCSIKSLAYNKYYEANIPVEYWNLNMKRDFIGSKILSDEYTRVAGDLQSFYHNGSAICFGGNNGIGKSMVATSILKKATLKNFSCLYTTLSDAVNVLTLPSSEDKFSARKELTIVDFLVIDEFDPRFIGSDNAGDLFGRTLETIFRTRSQNKLPTIMCSNSPNPVESFTGSIKVSIDSLMSRVKIIPILASDHRKIQARENIK